MSRKTFTKIFGLLLIFNFIAMGPTSASIRHPSLVQNCGFTSFQPKSIWLACADGGEGIRGIKWMFWSKKSAVGKGTYFVNDCIPYCANGSIHEKRVQVFLTVPKIRKGKTFLTKLEVRSPTGNIPLSESSFLYEIMY